MEKKVTGIDLDELKRAREEMYQEMGITPPESANNFDNVKKTEQVENPESEELQQTSRSEDNSEINGPLSDDEELLDLIENFITNADADLEDETQSTLQEDQVSKEIVSPKVVKKRNLSHYDVFAPYEINGPIVSSEEDEYIEEESEISESKEDDDLIKTELGEDSYINFDESQIAVDSESERQLVDINEFDENNDETIGKDLSDELSSSEYFPNDAEEFTFDNIPAEDEEIANEDETAEETLEESEDVIEDLLDQDVQDENEPKEDMMSNFSSNEIQSQQNATTQPSNINVSINLGGNLDSYNSINDATEFDLTAETDTTEIDNFDGNVTPQVETNETETAQAYEFDDEEPYQIEKAAEEMSEIVQKDNHLDEIVQKYELSEDDDDIFGELLNAKSKELKERKTKIEKKSEEIQIDLLPEIEPINYVNVLSMQDFKTSDNFTFVLGRAETGNIVFENLKQSYNIAFFANENSYELLHSMILSFMLKNAPSEFKLALCDGAINHNFNYYEGSKYLYSDISKSEDSTCNMFANIVSELEDRYRTLARFNVRSIEEYNLLAKNTQAPKLSQILLVIDGYNELMHSSSFEKIKSGLYQILRLGRIAGIYAIVVTNKKIEEDIINFNLPSRIGFKCSESDDSISMIGESGIDKLANKNEYLYSSIHSENAQHLRQPMISDAIIRILIDNIEK